MQNVHKPSNAIKDWNADDQPREKLISNGADMLSNAELIAILLRTGNRSDSALSLARQLLKLGKDNLEELGKLGPSELMAVKGIGITKAVTIMAALELGRRRHASVLINKPVIHTSNDIGEYLRTLLKDYNHEVFAIVYLNRSNKINNVEILSRGGITATVVDPRIVLKKALDEKATGIVLSHNHPSGSTKPSRADEEITQKIKQAAAYFDIRVLDHIIVSEEGYFSFADEGLL